MSYLTGCYKTQGGNDDIDTDEVSCFHWSFLFIAVIHSTACVVSTLPVTGTTNIL